MLFCARCSFAMGIIMEASYTLKTLEKTPLKILLCSINTFLFKLFSRDMPKKGCFLLTSLKVVVLGQKEKSRSRALCLVYLCSH